MKLWKLLSKHQGSNIFNISSECIYWDNFAFLKDDVEEWSSWNVHGADEGVSGFLLQNGGGLNLNL